ncbi:hypothetical protein LXL04_000677 [Taraxacum kok-saghyz]
MPNRSLQEWLFSDRSLNWERRFDILLDVSRALEFLHGECDPPLAIGTPLDSSTANEVDFAVALQASSSSTPVKNKVASPNLKLGFTNEKGKELSIGNIENGGGDDWINNKFTSYDDDLGLNFDNNHIREPTMTPSDDRKTGKKQWGKDWWWKQDGTGFTIGDSVCEFGSRLFTEDAGVEAGYRRHCEDFERGNGSSSGSI